METETWNLKSETSFLADSRNFTGYTQTIRETTANADGTTKTIDYTFGHDEIAQRTVERDDQGAITSDETLVFGHDGHGSVRVLYDLAEVAAGLINQVATFAAYGQLIAVHAANATVAGTTEAAFTSNLGYSGEQWDASLRMQNLRARAYDPANGRFIGLDPFAGNMQDPQSLHKYAYVHGDPVQGIDPTGEMASFSVSTVGSIALSLARIGVGVGTAFSTVNLVVQYRSWGNKRLETGKGGYDATDKLTELRDIIKASWISLTIDQKNKLVNQMHSVFEGGLIAWDIPELTFGGKDAWTGFITGDNVAEQTLTFRRHVYPVAEVNYVLWGIVNKLAYDDNIQVERTNHDSIVNKSLAYRVVFGGLLYLNEVNQYRNPQFETFSGKAQLASFGWHWAADNFVVAPVGEALIGAVPSKTPWPYRLSFQIGVYGWISSSTMGGSPPEVPTQYVISP